MWAASLEAVDRDLFIVYNKPRLAQLHRAAGRGSMSALAQARALQARIDACRKVGRLKAAQQRVSLPCGHPLPPAPDPHPLQAGAT